MSRQQHRSAPPPAPSEPADPALAALSAQISAAPAANKNVAVSLRPTAADAELTWRALFAGCLLGALLAAANVYTALKTGYIDGGSITAAVLGFAAFRTLGKRYTALENNLTQTVAASAAVMSFVAGVAGPIPALARAGFLLPSWALALWSFALGVIGIGVGAALRARLIGAEALPFPTGTATAEVIAAMHESGASALRRARGLLLMAAVAALVAWLRDGPLGLLPQVLALSGPYLGINVSPLLFATGLISGLRAGVSMLIGGLAAWLVFVPWLLQSGIVAGEEHGQLIGWLLWPAVGLVLSSSLTTLALQWRALLRGFVDLRALWAPGQPTTVRERAPLVLGSACLLSVIALVALARPLLGLSPVTTVLALALSVLLAIVCARGAGETDIAPAGDMGGLTQLVFGSPVSKASSLACGGMANGTATQTAQMLWAFKAGQRLGADPRRQTMAQLIGAAVGCIVVVPTYEVVVRAYGLGSDKLPAISVLSWEATATAVQGGLAALPQHAATAGVAAFALGAVMTVLGKRFRYLPSPVALGVGFLLPLPMTVTLFLGAVTLTLLDRYRPLWAAEHVESIAGGAIAGESLFAVVFAVLIALGFVAG
ncbi:MAG: OPT/YSL family transporter [Polyangiales bacterium]